MVAFCVFYVAHAAFGADKVPRKALEHRSLLVRTARAMQGMDAPIALYAAQIHQESSWRADAESPYAQGLTQFTAPTAEWAAMRWKDLRPANVWSPGWAIRAMIRYDAFLKERARFDDECDQWAATLAGYNGGRGWINRDARLAEQNGYNPRKWWGHVERFSNRSESAFRENRNYPRHIVALQKVYSGWSERMVCVDSEIE